MERQIWLIGGLTWFLVIWVAARIYRPKTDPYARLKQFVAEARGKSFIDETKSFTERVLAPLATRFMPKGVSYEEMRQKILYAGKPKGLTPESFFTYKLGCTALFPGLVLILNAGNYGNETPAVMLIGAAIGYLLPDRWLAGLVKQRQRRIAKETLDFVDLLAVACEAGASSTEAIKQICRDSDMLIAREWERTYYEITAGKPNAQAFSDLANRNGVEELSHLVSAIKQSEHLGTPLANTLRIQADQLRLMRRHRISEKARVATVRAIVPMVLIFIPFLIILCAPAVATLLNGF